MIYQIEEVLPFEMWKRVVINETNEQLVEIKENDHVMYGSRVSPLYEENSYFLRRTVAGMFYAAAAALLPDYRLVIIEGIRSLERQQLLWDNKCREISEADPDLSAEEVARRARLVVAMPKPLANHNCGGAVDVTIAHDDGTLVDMGTMPQDVRDPKLTRMFSTLITPEQKANRLILRRFMIEAGFAYYPGEWWHYCYGDRMWAVYTGRSECYYGPHSGIV